MLAKLLPVSFNGKCGYIDRSGKLVIPLKFTAAGPFSEGLATVQLPGEKNHHACIDESGAIVFEPRWGKQRPELFGRVQEGMVSAIFKVKKDYLMGYFNREGELVIPPRYHITSGSFKDGVAVARDSDNRKSRYIDKTGATRFGDYDHIMPFQEGLACVGIDFKYGYIDATGKLVIPFKRGDRNDFSDGVAAFQDEKSKKHGYIDKKGKVVIPATLGFTFTFKDGLAAVSMGEKTGFIDKTGELAFETLVDSAYAFSEGLCGAKLGEKSGYIDRKGHWVIEPCFDAAGGFSQGRAAVTIKEKVGIIDTKGRFILEPSFSQIDAYGEIEKDLAWASRRGKATDSLSTWLDLDGKPLWMPSKALVGTETKSEYQQRAKSSGQKGLSERVKKELQRLGAVALKKPSLRTLDVPLEDLNEATRELLLGYKWPKNTTYCNEEDKYDRNVRMVDFNYMPTMVTENEGIDDCRILMFAIAHGGNDMLCVDLDDKNPSDPHVYMIDHVDAFDRKFDAAGKLSKFLSQLEKESKRKD